MMRKNPKKGKTTHPDLFSSEDTAVFVPLEDLSQEDILQMKPADFSEEEWQRLDEDVRAEILANDEGSIEALTDNIKGIVESEIDNRKHGDEVQDVAEGYFEPRIQDGQLVDKAMDEIPEDMPSRITQGARVSEAEVLHEIKERLEDLENWEFAWQESARGSVDYIDADEWVGDSGLIVSKENLDAQALEILLALRPDQLKDAKRKLKRKGVYLDLEALADPTRSEHHEIEGSFLMPGFYTADVNWDGIEAKVLEALTSEEYRKTLGAKTPRDEVKIVYEYPDGHFVADLRGDQLRAEGRTLGICVGHPQYNYKRDVESKKTKIFSLRSPSGESKFCIEGHLESKGGSKVSYVAQVKGKANRLPGFDRGKEDSDDAKVKKAEVERLVEFISAIGVKPEDVRDMQPALRALTRAPKTNPARRVRKAGPRVHCAWCKRRA